MGSVPIVNQSAVDEARDTYRRHSVPSAELRIRELNGMLMLPICANHKVKT